MLICNAPFGHFWLRQRPRRAARVGELGRRITHKSAERQMNSAALRASRAPAAPPTPANDQRQGQRGTPTRARVRSKLEPLARTARCATHTISPLQRADKLCMFLSLCTLMWPADYLAGRIIRQCCGGDDDDDDDDDGDDHYDRRRVFACAQAVVLAVVALRRRTGASALSRRDCTDRGNLASPRLDKVASS